MAKKTKTVDIHRISGPVVNATEIVAARISDSDTGFDTHNCYDCNKGIYTIPVSGIYQVNTVYSDESGSHGESKIVQMNAGDTLQIPAGQPFIQGDWVFVKSNESIGIYKDWKVTIIESNYPMMVGTVLDTADHNMVKIPTGSTLRAILVLYGQSK